MTTTTSLNFTDIPVRFFLIRADDDDEDGEVDIHEVSECEFVRAEGDIKYERHTVHANGVKQICLTKNPYGEAL